MRREDIARLELPYDEPVEEGGRAFRERLGVDCPEITRLEEGILADLDPELFGVGWWATQLGTKRRILIADCLYQAVASVDDNLVEAKLHLLNLQHWYDEENRQNADVIYADPTTGEARVRVSPPRSAMDQLPATMSTLHVVGALQSLNTALDCLAGAIVGVWALPMNIQRASYGTVIWFLEGRGRPKPSESHSELGRALARRVSDSGPAGWLDWMRQFRNASLHRGRRLNAKHLTQRHPILLDSNGQVIPRADTTSVLPAEPGLSEVEAILAMRPLQLTEPAMVTLGGCLDSTRELVRAVGSDLLEVWARRRADPAWLPQPEAQWDSVDLDKKPEFEGYSPGAASSKMPVMIAHPSYSRRIQAAALESKNRPRWDNEFD
jgi:hypothetical protein